MSCVWPSPQAASWWADSPGFALRSARWRRRSARRRSSASFRMRDWMRAPISASNAPRICTVPSSPFQKRTLRLRRLRRCRSARSAALWCSAVQRWEAWANSSGGSVLAISTRSASPCTASGLVERAARARPAALAMHISPSASADRAAGTCSSSAAVRTLRAASDLGTAAI